MPRRRRRNLNTYSLIDTSSLQANAKIMSHKSLLLSSLLPKKGQSGRGISIVSTSVPRASRAASRQGRLTVQRAAEARGEGSA